ncbi:family 78 glycoside hydrolase catalytic domain [Flindersiella endophytica]
MLSVLTPYDPRVEYARSPLGLDEPNPRFGWHLATTETGHRAVVNQAAYQVRVATSADQLAHPATEASDMWDSGRIESGRSGQVEYAGEPLAAFRRYYWAVRVWDTNGQASDWSETAWFETGPLSPADWGEAIWIGRSRADRSETSDDETEAPAPLLRKRFQLEGEVESARLYACGLGFGEYFLNGERIGSAVLDPAPTNYDATVLFSSYDVTGMLPAGETGDNGCVLAAQLGRGRYQEKTPNIWRWHEAPWMDEPKLIALLVIELADGRIQRVTTSTDAGWLTADGPIRGDSLFAGERYDARLERPGWTTAGYDDAGWDAAVAANPPKGVLRSQTHDQIRAVAEVPAAGLTEPKPGVYVFDLGKQIAGWARLTLSGPEGTELQIRYGERLHADGTVDHDQGLIYREIQTDTYVLTGNGSQTYEPRFSYKGFQYVQIDGYPGRPEAGDLVGVEVHTAVESSLEFSCDNELVSRLHAATRNAVLNNLHGVPTDTPVFEKNGWTGDAHLTADVAAYNFWMPRFYTKWLRDWTDSQLPSGEFPPIVPTSGWGYLADSEAAIKAPIPAWDAAYVEIPWVMYRHYGDERILARHYDGARKYIDYLTSDFLVDDVVLVGLGDWLPPGIGGMPPEGPGVYETIYAYRFVELLSKIAGVLGKDGDLAAYAELSDRIRAGFNRAFFDASAGIYHGERETGYRQAANVMALEFGLVPESERRRVFDNLVADIHDRDDHLDTGVFGTKFLLPLLTREGLVDLAFKVAMQPTYPSYGFWLAEGGTALYEHWGADSRSRNHHFFGHVDQWFIEDLTGLRPAAPGFARVRVRPNPPSQVGEMNVTVATVRGQVAAGWRRIGEEYEVRVEVPTGVEAEVHVPKPGGEYAVSTHGPGTHVLR